MKEQFEAECRRVWADAFVAATLRRLDPSVHSDSEIADICEAEYRRRYESAAPPDTTAADLVNVPEWAAKISYGFCSAQDADGSVWQCREYADALNFDGSGWFMEAGDAERLGTFTLRDDYASVCWIKTWEDKLLKVTIQAHE